MDLTLTTEQIDFFHTNGYLTLPAIIGAEELEPIRAHYDRIFRERIGWDDGRMFDLGGVEGDNDPIGPDYAAPVSAAYFNNRKLSIFGGSNEIQRGIIAKVKMGG